MARVAARLHQPSQDWFVAEIRTARSARGPARRGRAVDRGCACSRTVGRELERDRLVQAADVHAFRGPPASAGRGRAGRTTIGGRIPDLSDSCCAGAHDGKARAGPNRGDVRSLRRGLVRRDPRQRDVGWEPGIPRGGGGLAELRSWSGCALPSVAPVRGPRVAVCTPEVSAVGPPRVISAFSRSRWGAGTTPYPTSNRRSR